MESHKLLDLSHYASRAFPDFLRDMFDAEDRVLDHALLRFSPLRVLPSEIAEKIGSKEVSLPPRSFLENGTQSLEGLYFLVSLAKTLQSRKAFEIGTFTGVTAWTLACNLPELQVYTLDLPAGDAPALHVERDDKPLMPERQRRHVFQGRPEESRIISLEGDSASFDFAPFQNAFDLVYIDGSHSYEYVAKDTESALSMVSPNGVIVWDDYLSGWKGLVRFLHERTDLQLYLVPDTRLVLWMSDGAATRLMGNLNS